MPLSHLPPLEGTVLLEEAERRPFASDIARNLERLPLAVVQPVCAEDVAKIIQYANREHLKVSIRGQGHSRYGQTLTSGIVIDTSTLNRVTLADSTSADAQAGAFWGEVSGVTLAQGLTPPAMGTCPKLSVGGMLSAGGFSNSSHLYGAIADTVEELDVITGDGRLLTCSREQNAELLWMVLAGMGQCGVIVRARLRLIPAPTTVVRQELYYDDLETFLADGSRLVLSRGLHHLTSRATQRADGRWIFSINVGRFYGAGEEPEWHLAASVADAAGGLRFQSKAEPVRACYWDYLMRESAKNTAEALSRERQPRRESSLTLFVPLSQTKKFVENLLSNPAELAGLADFQLNPFHTRKTRCPLFKFPEEEIAYLVWLYPRHTPLEDDARHQEVREMNRAILGRMRAIGGKSYPPYTPYFSQAEWEEHYGPEVWKRLAAAKQEYDPSHVLTPEMCMFAGHSSG